MINARHSNAILTVHASLDVRTSQDPTILVPHVSTIITGHSIASYGQSKIDQKRTLMERYSIVFAKEQPNHDDVIDVCFRLICISMELYHWKDAENYARDLRRFISMQSQNVWELRGACEFYIGLNLAHQRNYV